MIRGSSGGDGAKKRVLRPSGQAQKFARYAAALPLMAAIAGGCAAHRKTARAWGMAAPQARARAVAVRAAAVPAMAAASPPLARAAAVPLRAAARAAARAA